ncbi:hypothetical protein CUJ83_11005 [Methanocella sp. CWC-04]|uniref:Uncharacterized protein n=1 Tax=Methanooceanicella nereidis TaxID=2052831 RepID=A0AAP2W6Q1_9EURY|nr:hypothetical protein [Methanocella sp. CWC-04]MCD1295527.1 hypothetical protein [Methanocella sp. CWC-04]
MIINKYLTGRNGSRPYNFRYTDRYGYIKAAIEDELLVFKKQDTDNKTDNKAYWIMSYDNLLKIQKLCNFGIKKTGNGVLIWSIS